MRALAFSVSGSETFATEPVLDRSASHSVSGLETYASWRAPGVGATGSFNQLISAGSKGFTDPHAWSVSG